MFWIETLNYISQNLMNYHFCTSKIIHVTQRKKQEIKYLFKPEQSARRVNGPEI